jgi:hypothetical protein
MTSKNHRYKNPRLILQAYFCISRTCGCFEFPPTFGKFNIVMIRFILSDQHCEIRVYIYVSDLSRSETIPANGIIPPRPHGTDAQCGALAHTCQVFSRQNFSRKRGIRSDVQEVS